jgi:hypothetical protein
MGAGMNTANYTYQPQPASLNYNYRLNYRLTEINSQLFKIERAINYLQLENELTDKEQVNLAHLIQQRYDLWVEYRKIKGGVK